MRARGASARRAGLAAVVLAGLMGWRPSQAATDCAAIGAGAPDQPTRLHRLIESDCLGGKADPDPAIVALRKRIDDIPGIDDADRWAETLYVVRAVERRIVAWPEGAVTTECRTQLVGAVVSVESALLKGAVVPESGVACGPSSAFAPTCWEIDPASRIVIAAPGCHLFADASVQGAEEALRSVQVTHDALIGFSAPAVSTYHAEASELSGRWWSYFRDTRMQFPWELVANALCFGRKIRSESKTPFHEPPTHQLIYLHPEIAFEYLPHAPDGEQLKPGLSVELIGFNRWTWEGTVPAKAFGAALVANYADVATVKDWRAGLAIHVRHRYTFGATRASGETGYFVSADLAGLVADKRKKAKSFIDALKP
jgi:hypothetical protein